MTEGNEKLMEVVLRHMLLSRKGSNEPLVYMACIEGGKQRGKNGMKGVISRPLCCTDQKNKAKVQT